MKYLYGCAVLLALSSSVHAQDAAKISLKHTIQLPGIKGKFDHFALDEAGNRLFVASPGSKSVLVVDLVSGKKVGALDGLSKPHGLAWIAATGRLFVADGGTSKLDVYEGDPLKLTKQINLSEDADDMVYDPSTKLLYVGHGGTNSANPARVAVVDAAALRLTANLPVGSHPEALELDPEQDRIFVNIADLGQIVVIDGTTHAAVDTWTLKGVKGNTPLAYDVADHMLLVACRTPSKLIVLDVRTGQFISEASSDAGADDLFYDSSTRRAYLVAGSGNVDAYTLSQDGKLRILPAIQTASGAKTGLLAPSRGELFVGIPGADTDAEIRVYGTGNR